MLRAIDITKAQGLRVVQVLALVDREEGGRENLAKEGHILESIFTKSDIV
jgi:orotate phosphoribosyltransferase